MRLHGLADDGLINDASSFGEGGETVNGCSWFPGMNRDGKLPTKADGLCSIFVKNPTFLANTVHGTK
jgi:hypothetical protein